MRYKYHFSEFCCPELLDFLSQNRISYKVTGEGLLRTPIVTFDIWSNKRHAEYWLHELKLKNCSPIVYTDYSESDRMNANLLWLLPQKQKIDIINVEGSFSYSCEYVSVMGDSCYKHEEQTSLITIAKEPPSQARTVFWTESTSFSEVFVDQRIRDAVSSSSLVGVDFLNVLLKSGDVSGSIYQMTSKNVAGRACIELGHGEIVAKCPICGKEQYDINSGYQLHLIPSKLPMQSDLYVTERMFGGGIAFPLYVISQRFYRLLKENGLTAGAKFSPVVEV